MNTRILKLLARYTRNLQRDHKRRNTLNAFTSSPHSCCTVIRKDAICDPLLGSVDNVHIALFLSSCGDTSDIRPGYHSQHNISVHLPKPKTKRRNSPSGSVTPRQNLVLPLSISGKNLLFCSSFPKLITGGPPIEFPHPSAQITPR